MTFLGVGLDGSEAEFAEFIDQNGVQSVTHITGDTHPELVDQFFADYGVNAVPTFVVSDASGETRDLSGWNESSIREDLEWLVAT